MRVGGLKKRVTFQKNQPTTTGLFTDVKDNWVDQLSVWAGFESQEGQSFEVDKVGQMRPVTYWRITVHYYGPIDPNWRLKLLPSNRIFGINAVLNVDQRNHWTTLLCKEIVPVQEPTVGAGAGGGWLYDFSVPDYTGYLATV